MRATRATLRCLQLRSGSAFPPRGGSSNYQQSIRDQHPPPQGPAKVRKILDTTRDARIPQGFGRVRLSLRVGDRPSTNDRSRDNHPPLEGPAKV